MKLKIFIALFALIPGIVWGATPSKGRVGVATAMAGKRAAAAMPKKNVTPAKTEKVEVVEEDEEDDEDESTFADCRDAYRECMDEFCLMDESEGDRCSCSDNIKKSKSLIQEIQKIQEEADKLFTEGVEKKKLGAKARFIFGESERAKKSSSLSGVNFLAWIGGGQASLDADDDIGDALYGMAADSCESVLKKCGAKAEMEETLYRRQIVNDCKSFAKYLEEQKIDANQNKRTAEAAVRAAQLEMFDTTDKYNRGECLLAYRACIADKGGCGVHFENCLDEALLGRRANACENVLDQCMASREYVLEDWKAESKSILDEAAKYADKNMRKTCLAQIQYCLEDGCSTSTNSACLSNVEVAAGVCPIITECEEKIPGIQGAINDKLGELRIRFCQNDVDKCLQDKCGVNFTAPECLGKSAYEISKLCPKDMFSSCKNEEQFEIIVQSALLQMDYKMLQGCLNYYGEMLGRVCGTDMSCLPHSDTVAQMKTLPSSPKEVEDLRDAVRQESRDKVAGFFEQFETEKTITECKSSQQPGSTSEDGELQYSVFKTAQMIAEISAENRYLAELETKTTELSRAADIKEAEQNCLTMYQVEKRPEIADDVSRKHGKNAVNKSYSYIKSVSFEPKMRNCHVCRMQRVCEVGGEKKATSALKTGAGTAASFASAGTMVSPGWGTLIGGVVGAAGGAIGGALSGGQEDFCQELESCEDINM